MNIFAYVGNDPINKVDPSGLCTVFTTYKLASTQVEGPISYGKVRTGIDTLGCRGVGSDGFTYGGTSSSAGIIDSAAAALARGLQELEGGKGQCPTVPNPGSGKDVLNKNIEMVLHEKKVEEAMGPLSTPADTRSRLFARSVPGGQWDYKARIPGSVTFGNFHFGAVAAATGMSISETLRWAAGAQVVQDIKNGKIPTGYDNPDDPPDIRDGYNYFKKGCNK